jgi:hypothetical protein
MTLDASGNLGLGVTPSAWGSGKAFELGQVTGNALWGLGINSLYLVSNARWNGSNYVYTNNGAANLYGAGTGNGTFTWFTAPSGTAGNAITFTQAMTLDASGLLTVGNTSPAGSSQITAYGASNGQIAVQNSTNWSRLLQNAGNLYIDNGVGGSAGNIIFRSSSSTIEVARITSAGNLGVGTTDEYGRVNIQRFTSAPQSTLAIGDFATVTNDVGIYLRTTGTAGISTAGGPIAFYRGGPGTTESARIDSSGNLGLGVTPSATNTAFRAFEVGNFTVFSGTGGLSSYIDNNAFFNTSSQYIYKGSGHAGEYAMLTSDGSHRWYTAPSGTAGNAITFTQAMTLDASGNLLVGRTSRLNNGRIEALAATSEQAIVAQVASNGNSLFQGFNATGTVAFQVTGDAGLLLTSLGTGIVYSNAGNLTSTNPSDLRLKENVQDLGWGLAQINALRPVSYAWKNNPINQGTQYGFIAQEVQAVMPELVREFETEEGIRLGLEKEGIYAAMVKAIQEQQAIIESLKARLDAANL